MNNFFTLTKYNLINNIGLNKLNKRFNKSGKLGLGALVLIIYLLVLALVTFYMFSFGTIFNSAGTPEYIFLLGITISSLLIFFSTLGQANSYIFKTKDYDLLNSIPLKSKTIVLSKIVSLYIQNLLFSFTIMLSINISYSIFAEFNILVFLEYLFLSLLTPLFPIAVSCILAFFFGFIPISKKIKNIITTTLYLAFIVLFMLFYFKLMNMDETDVAGQVASIYNAMSNVYFLGKFGFLAMSDIKYFLLFIGISLFALLFFIFICSKGYNVISTKEYTKKNKNYNLEKTEYKNNKNNTLTLFKKEIKVYFGIPSYLVNTIIGPVLSIMGTILLCLNIGNLTSTLNQDNAFSNPNNFAMMIITAMILFCFSIVTTTASSLSLEGKSLWIIKSLPIKTKNIFVSKILVNLLITIPFIIIDIIISSIIIKPEIIYSIGALLISCIFAIGVSIFGLFINILLPRFDFDNPIRVIKQSGSVALNMVVDFVYCIIIIVFGFITFLMFQNWISLLVMLLLAIIFTIVSYILIKTIGVKRYNKI